MSLQMMANPHADKIFPKDVLKRAKEYLAAIPGGTGAYTSSQGAPICREHVAAGITHRDNGIKSDPGNIFMSDGASQVGLLKLSISASCAIWFGQMLPQEKRLRARCAACPCLDREDAMQKMHFLGFCLLCVKRQACNASSTCISYPVWSTQQLQTGYCD